MRRCARSPGPRKTITILEGWRLEELIAYLGTTDLTMNLDEFRTLVMTPPPDLLAAYPFLAELPVGRTLEGYLYPDTYRVFANASARDIVDRLLTTFDQRFTQEMRDALIARSLTIDYAVRLASIVEREAVLDEERPLIAGVYTNRLQTSGWVLNADPTLQWGLATAQYGGLPMDQWGSGSPGGRHFRLPVVTSSCPTSWRRTRPTSMGGCHQRPSRPPACRHSRPRSRPTSHRATSSSWPRVRTAFATVRTDSR